jgi:hypothetical protein
MTGKLTSSFVCAATGLALASCGSDPSTPTPVRMPVVVASPTPAPSPTPAKAATLPPGMVCGDPTPPPMLRMNVRIHGYEGSRVVFDSKPVVPNTNGYCDKAGFGDWKYCDTRPEGHPERVACDYLVAGISEETGRWGPTWYFGDTLCGSDPTKCAHHPTEQFMTVGKVKGTYEACAADTTPVAPDGSRCGIYELK